MAITAEAVTETAALDFEELRTDLYPRLMRLAGVRAVANGTSYHHEWQSILDRERLHADVHGDDSVLQLVALDVLQLLDR